MNIAKNMEAIFVAAAVLLGVSAYATAALPEVAVRQAAPVSAVAAAQAEQSMPVVVVAAKRLTAAEKAALAQ